MMPKTLGMSDDSVLGATATVGGEVDERSVAKSALEAAEDELQSVCASHAATFVAVERRGAAVEASLGSLIEALDKSLPRVAAAKACLEKEGGEALAALAEKHRLRRRTLLQHSSLLELLELPSLMDACVRSNLYDEALSIAGFANTLERRHLHTANELNSRHAVSNVVADIRTQECDLRDHLLHRLKADITMPDCLGVVTALRRLNGLQLDRTRTTANQHIERLHAAMELRLQVDFLEARDVWLLLATTNTNNLHNSSSTHKRNSVLQSFSTSQQHYFLDSIHTYRTRCFEIATQFLTIFRASTGATLSASFPSSSPCTSGPVFDYAFQLLSMWTSRRVQKFLTNTARQLALVHDTSTLRDCIDAASFFATSMERIGADFRPLLTPVFEPTLVRVVTTPWNEGVAALKETLKLCREAGIASPLYATFSASELDNTTTKTWIDGDNKEEETPAAPRQLLALPPLARLVNAVLTGLNELRRCLLSSTFPSLRLALDRCMGDVRVILAANERAVHTPGRLRGEALKLRSVASELKQEFDSCVEPYLKHALEVAFGTTFPSNDSFLGTENNVTKNENDTEGAIQHVKDENIHENTRDLFTQQMPNDDFIVEEKHEAVKGESSTILSVHESKDDTTKDSSDDAIEEGTTISLHKDDEGAVE